MEETLIGQVHRMKKTKSKAGMAGRPEADIDWAKVDDLLVAGCMGTEIAAYLGLNPQTLYRRCEDLYKINFSEYLQEKRAKGDTLLHAAQFDEAVRKRNTTMLVWLGKNRLDQSDKKEITHEGGFQFNVINYGDKKPVTYQDANVIEAKVTKVEKEKAQVEMVAAHAKAMVEIGQEIVNTKEIKNDNE